MKQNTKLDFTNQSFYIGIDVHKRNWSVTIRGNSMVLKTFSMNPSPQGLLQYMKRNYPGGRYFSVYEAGYSGFWIHQQLSSFGFHNIVINVLRFRTLWTDLVLKLIESFFDSRIIKEYIQYGSARTAAGDGTRRNGRMRSSMRIWGDGGDC